jgi:8-oxo-dGTP pyrophosphatase MutT (NUDIX family)
MDGAINRLETPRQAAVIAFRRHREELEVCLIRRKDSQKWGIPKGFIDPGVSPEQAGLTEAVEEAGLCGQIIGQVVGMYEYEKFGSPCMVAVYVMQVLEQRRDWREMKLRERRWFSLDEAAALLASHSVASLWDRISERLASGVT